jgi:hypothetical protein
LEAQRAGAVTAQSNVLGKRDTKTVGSPNGSALGDECNDTTTTRKTLSRWFKPYMAKG